MEIVSSLSDDFDFFIAVGGDGTLNEVINGIKLDSTKTIGFLPCGTGNDFARNIYNNFDFKETLNKILSKNFCTKKIDLGSAAITESGGKIIEQKFINSLGIGFDADVAYQKGKIKLFSGIYSYIFSVLTTLIKFKPLSVNGLLDKVNFSGNKLLITVGNGRFSGGGFYLTPDALIDDGYLDVCMIDNLNRIQILKKFPKAFSDKIKSVSEVKLFKFKEMFAEFLIPVTIHVDGEVISLNANNVKVNILPKVINLIYEN